MPFKIPLELLAKEMTSPQSVQSLHDDRDRFYFYSGATKEIIKRHIQKEFKKKETVEGMCSRIVTINILKKVVNKLAQVYNRAPKRLAGNNDTGDQEALEQFAEEMNVNQRMKELNRSFKRDKRGLLELYLNKKCPALRVLPPQTYRVFSASPNDPSACDVIVQIIEGGTGKERFRYWDEDQQVDFNAKGETLTEVVQLSGPTGMGLPFIYLNEATYSTMPIREDDLMEMSVAIPIVLTDMLFGLKYQCWSVIWTIGAKGDFPFNPNSIIELDFGPDGQKPEIGTVKPDMDVDKLLSAVVFLLEMLLTTNDLKAGDVQLTTQSLISGVSKMIDNAEMLENREDQEAYFQTAEKALWEDKLPQALKHWRSRNELDPELDTTFSEDFQVQIHFQEPTVMLSEDKKVEVAKSKIEARLSSRKRELMKLEPEMTEDEIDLLIEEIDAEKANVSGTGVNGEVQEDDGQLEPDPQDPAA